MGKSKFFQKIINRFDRIDPSHVHDYLTSLAQEKGLMETIFNSMLEGIIVSDKDQRIIFVNDAALNFLSNSREALTFKSLPQYLKSIGLEEISDHITHNWGKLIHRDITIQDPDPRILNLNVFPLLKEQKEYLGLVLLLVDVTRVRQEDIENMRNEKIQTIGLMAACIAHEIGNPLNSLEIHLQLLTRDLEVLDEEKRKPLKELVEIIQSEIRRVDEIVRSFLVAARPMRPNLSGININMTIEDLLKAVNLESYDNNITLKISLDKKLPKANVDENQVKQALLNLIKNAIEAMPKGGCLKIKTYHDPYSVYIAIEDTGMGIPQEVISKIFDPYVTTKATGSGLGLMIAYRIIKDHGGKIEILSEKDKGSTFTVSLPLEVKKRVQLLQEAKPIQLRDEV